MRVSEQTGGGVPAAFLLEAGCTNQQIKAITGHTTDAEVGRYTAAANQKILADQAIEALGGSDREHKNG